MDTEALTKEDAKRIWNLIDGFAPLNVLTTKKDRDKVQLFNKWIEIMIEEL